jgi:guanylate kinase
MNKRVILCGPTASGKTFIRSKFAEKGYTYDVSYTSREPRNGEIDGKDYKFISSEEFSNRIFEYKFFEWVNYEGNYYGTGRYEFENSDLFIMETDGIKHLIEEGERDSSLIVYVNTPIDIRIERMKKRGWNTDKILDRLKVDHKKFDNFTDYDLMISSHDDTRFNQ